ncbi:MAG: adenosylcobinamide-GDP ribazoletransferase [Acidobacteria bacterium]|nr:MAG: adenosylcobinamide-GDP ribazoletransferase [Acidobacteriota bacterium]
MRLLRELLAAVQFLTRLPVPSYRFEPDMVMGAAKLYPIVGALVAFGAIALERLLRPHLPASAIAVAVLVYFGIITGGLYEDGLADTCDGLGAGGERKRMLDIMRDSRIGSFGTLAIVFSVLGRWVLLTAIAPGKFASYVLAAQVLCRWTALPLAVFLPPARKDGLGEKLANKISIPALLFGSVLAFAIVGFALRAQMAAPVAAVIAVMLVSGLIYRRKLGGITGDCFGASSQLAEIAVYVCAVWS